jgi:hypothetical protein
MGGGARREDALVDAPGRVNAVGLRAGADRDPGLGPELGPAADTARCATLAAALPRHPAARDWRERQK